jgi:hypothetical protein
MSIYPPDSPRAKFKKSVVNFLILFPFVISLFGIALALGTEPRILLERTGERAFRVTGSNQFAGYQFYSKTIEGVEGYRLADGSRHRREDTIQERNLQAKHKRLAFKGNTWRELSWGRTDDSRVIDDFMRGDATTLALAAPPPRWRMALSWACAALGGLTFCGVIKAAFFSKPSVFAR